MGRRNWFGTGNLGSLGGWRDIDNFWNLIKFALAERGRRRWSRRCGLGWRRKDATST